MFNLLSVLARTDLDLGLASLAGQRLWEEKLASESRPASSQVLLAPALSERASGVLSFGCQANITKVTCITVSSGQLKKVQFDQVFLWQSDILARLASHTNRPVTRTIGACLAVEHCQGNNYYYL